MNPAITGAYPHLSHAALLTPEVPPKTTVHSFSFPSQAVTSHVRESGPAMSHSSSGLRVAGLSSCERLIEARTSLCSYK